MPIYGTYSFWSSKFKLQGEINIFKSCHRLIVISKTTIQKLLLAKSSKPMGMVGVEFSQTKEKMEGAKRK
jgi:hypothetical protein